MANSSDSIYLGTLCCTLPLGVGSGLILYGDQQFDWQGKKVNLFGVDLRSVDKNVDQFVGKHLRLSGPLLPPGGGFDDAWPVIDATRLEVVPYSGATETDFASDSVSLSVVITPAEFSWAGLTTQPSIHAVFKNIGTEPRRLEFKDSGRLSVKVTEITPTPLLATKAIWTYPGALSDVLGSVTLNPSETLETKVALRQQDVPKAGIYLLNAEVSGHEQYNAQTQFLIRS